MQITGRRAEPGEILGCNPIRVEHQRSGPRLITQAHHLNRQLDPPPHFRLEDLRFSAAMLRPGDWLTSLDISKFYNNFPTSAIAARWLGFRWRNVDYIWLVLPFGVSWAPLWATKMLRPVLAHARATLCLRSAQYFDDSLLADQDRQRLRLLTRAMADLLQSLGFTINTEKSVWEPTQSIRWLGFIVSTSDWVVRCSMLPDKRRSLQTEARRLAKTQATTAFSLARFLGALASNIAAFLPARSLARSLHATLQQALNNQPTLSFHRVVVSLSSTAQAELRLIVRALSSALWTNRPFIVSDSPSLIVTSDASAWGWSAWISDPRSPDEETHFAQAQWPRHDAASPLLPEPETILRLCAPFASPSSLNRVLPLPSPLLIDPPVGRARFSTNTDELHSSITELTAMLHAVLALRQRVHHRQIAWRSDNTAALAALLSGSSASPVLNTIAARLALTLALLDTVVVQATHIAGDDNTRADFGSRQWRSQRSHLEWPLEPIIFKALQRSWSTTLELDAFACSTNAQLPRFWALADDALAEALDAFAQPWIGRRLFLNPPFHLMERVVAKLLAEPPAEAIVVGPEWRQRNWFHLLQQTAERWTTLPTWAVQTGPDRRLPEPLVNPAWRLRAWLIRSDSC